MKKKLLSITLAVMTLSGTLAHADAGIKYARTGEKFDYGSDYVWVAAEKGSDKIIPLSEAHYDDYLYAYTDADEIELKKVIPPEFTDLGEKYEWDLYIRELSARGVLNGFEDNSFRPDIELTRAQMAAILARMFSVELKVAGDRFSDISPDSWYAGYVYALNDIGVIDNAERFNPQNLVTREELTAMAYRMIKHTGLLNDADYAFANYSDTDKVSEYALGAYKSLLGNGYMIIQDVDEHNVMDSDDDEYFLYPQKNVTRYDCASFLYYIIRDFTSKYAPPIKRDTAPDAEIPVLDGSTSTYDITRNIYAEYYFNSENNPDMPKAHSKTSNSYKRLIDGEVEMIFVPDPSEEVKKYAEEKGVTLKYIPIANEALVFFTSDKNTAKGITTEQVRNIYINNAVTNWKELGGEDKGLTAYCRNNDSGSHAQMEKFILDGKDINDSISKEHTSWIMSSILTDVDSFNAEHPGSYAIGYSLYYYYNVAQTIIGPVNLKLLSIDGVEPTEDTISEGSYPYTTYYYAVIRDEENPKVDKFVDLMTGEFGDTIVEVSGLGKIKK